MPGADRIAIGKRRRSSGRFLLRKDAVAGWQDAVQNTGEEAVSIQKLTGQKALETLSSQLYLADTYRYSTGIPYPLMEQLVRIAGAGRNL